MKQTHISGRLSNGRSVEIPLTAIKYISSYKSGKRFLTDVRLGYDWTITLETESAAEWNQQSLRDPYEPPKFTTVSTKDGREIIIAVDAIAYVDRLTDRMVLKSGEAIELGTSSEAILNWLQFTEWASRDIDGMAADDPHPRAPLSDEMLKVLGIE